MRTSATTFLVSIATIFLVTATARPAAAQKKEYLSDAEADKIRDAGSTGPRIELYVMFAADRIKKLQYEFAHLDPADNKRTDRLNSLINSYSGCLDDAADLLDIGIERQENIRDGVKQLQTQTKEFLPYLEKLDQSGPELETYKENLDDAIESTKDAGGAADKAAKDLAPGPVRRKPS